MLHRGDTRIARLALLHRSKQTKHICQRYLRAQLAVMTQPAENGSSVEQTEVSDEDKALAEDAKTKANQAFKGACRQMGARAS